MPGGTQSGGNNVGIAQIIAIILASGVAAIVATTLTTSNLVIPEQAAPALSAAGQAKVYADSTAHNLQVSQNGGAYSAIGGGGGSFSTLTGGTNTTAAMVVGTGASLGVSGSGTIAATSTTTNANLTGPVTSVGNATTITDDAVTTSKILNANVTAAKLVNAGVFTGDSTTTFPALTIGNGAITAVKMVNAGVFTGDATTTFPAITIGAGAITNSKIANTTIDLTAKVTGVLPVANGGSGAATLTGVLIGNGTSAFTVVTAPSGTIVGTTDTQTLTNKRITKRLITEADATSWTPAGDTSDISYQLNTQATGTLTINAPSGTPTGAQVLILRIKATNVQTYSWNAIYRSGTDISLPTVSTAAKTDYIGFLYNSVDSKWDVTSLARGY